MKKIILFSVLCISLNITLAQTIKKENTTAPTSSGQDQTLINALLANLQADPKNPLKIDKEQLLNIANALPSGGLKDKLLSYGANLGLDPNLSMRQVYYDLNTAFTSNANLSSLSNFAGTGKSLDLLLNNSQQLINSIKGGLNNYKPGMFMNDPQFINTLQKTTGLSQTNAGMLSIGVELALAFVEQAKLTKQFRSDYTSYAEMSSQMVYPEGDPALSKALIDASIGRNALTMITPVYRYDFDNGSSIRVENGMLKYFNPAKGIIKNLIPVENRNDGRSYVNSFTGTFFDTKEYQPQLITIGTDDKNFILQTGKIEKENACDDCLKRFEFFTIETDRGTVDEFKYKHLVRHDNILSTIPFGDSVKTIWRLANSSMYEYRFNTHTNKATASYFKQPSRKFRYTEGYKDVSDNNANYVSSNHHFNYSFVKNNMLVSLYWGIGKNEDKIASSSFFDVTAAGKGKLNFNDAMVNELTGLVMSDAGILYFITGAGEVGRIDLNTTAPSDEQLTGKMRRSLVKANIEPYNFRVEKTYLFNSTQYANYHHLPQLSLTPDEKHLIYVVANKMYVVNVDNLQDVKSFTMTIDPYIHFYAKENGEPTIYFQSFNEFKFPVTKKYSLNKLIHAKIETRVETKPVAGSARTEEKQTAKEKAAPSGSIADELKKLKDLLDAGAISKEEYEKAKKKVLEQ